MGFSWKHHWTGCIAGNVHLKKNICGIAGLDVRIATSGMAIAEVKERGHHIKNSEENIIKNRNDLISRPIFHGGVKWWMQQKQNGKKQNSSDIKSQ